jgi:hypothetical protein
MNSPIYNKYDKYDKYDIYGRNLTEQAKRQVKVPWINVIYHRGKIIIPYEKKSLIPGNEFLISFK